MRQLAQHMSSIYHVGARPPQSSIDWVGSSAFRRLSPGVTVYHDGSEEDARVLATEREPVNIAFQRLYDREALKRLVGYSESGEPPPIAAVSSLPNFEL